MGQVVFEREAQALAGAHDEVGLQTCALPVRLQRDGAVERERVGARGQGRAFSVALDPGDVLAVAEANREIAVHRDLALDPFDDPDDVVDAAAWRHEVDDPYPPAVADDLGLEDQRLGSIVLIDAAHLRGGPDAPVPVPVRPEQLSEAGVGVDARQAHPIDRAVARDQRDGRRVTDEAVVFELGRHANQVSGAVEDSQLGGCTIAVARPRRTEPRRARLRTSETLVVAAW